MRCLPNALPVVANPAIMGPKAWPDCTDSTTNIPGFGPVDEVFVHELTHVWQGYNDFFPDSFMTDSLAAQGWAALIKGDRNKAYTYKLGKPWASYNVEQHASMVEDWYKNGMNKTSSDPLWPYIKKFVRKGKSVRDVPENIARIIK